MNSLFSYSLVWFGCFGFFVALSAISSSVLIKIKKTEHRNLWEEDTARDTFWSTEERRLWDELMWNTPYWVKQDKNARIWIIVFRLSRIIGLLVWALPLFYIFIGLFLH
jgi:hypothetical protein